jgi:hypothetical protein
MPKRPDAADVLVSVMDRLFRFRLNMNSKEIVNRVYGVEENGQARHAYAEGKARMIDERGIDRWYCDLDLGNQLELAEMLLERYPDLAGYLNTNGSKS